MGTWCIATYFWHAFERVHASEYLPQISWLNCTVYTQWKFVDCVRYELGYSICDQTVNETPFKEKLFYFWEVKGLWPEEAVENNTSTDSSLTPQFTCNVNVVKVYCTVCKIIDLHTYILLFLLKEMWLFFTVIYCTGRYVILGPKCFLAW